MVNAVDQSPITGATITIAKTQLNAETDAEGQFAIDGVCSGDVMLQVAAKNCMPSDIPRKLTSGDQDLGDLAISAITTVTGRVVRALDRQPVENAAVLIQDLKTQTAENGEFQIAEAPAGPGMLRA